MAAAATVISADAAIAASKMIQNGWHFRTKRKTKKGLKAVKSVYFTLNMLWRELRQTLQR